MSKDVPLVKSLSLMTLILFLTQLLFFSIVYLFLKFSITIYIIFIFSCLLYHALLFILLVQFKNEFVIVPGNIPLSKVNLANLITLFRIASLPALFFCFLLIKTHPVMPFLIPFLALIFLTDFFDGMAARMLKQVTKIGKYLDSASDYAVLTFSTLLFFFFGLIPLWLFILIFIRLSTQITVVVVFFLMKKRLVYFISLIGKASIFGIMFYYVFVLFSFLGLPIPCFEVISIVLEICLVILIAASFVDKILNLRSELAGNKK
ncbi:MAG: CDP-alcohol phosphatidyltransferase family protein [Spirochaetales bacterium]|nr:CDP-alcohol phosphatidyltransferase family protein [Spirochaetales bacterium]